MTGDGRRRAPHRRRTTTVAALAAAVFVLAALNLGMGAVSVPADEVAGTLARRLRLDLFAQPGPGVDAVVGTLRLPRVLLAITVGGGLAAAGAALQGTFRNSLADPHLLGIGPGAAIGAVIGSLTGGVVAAVVAGAVVGAVVALLLRFLSERTSGDPARFILMGVALGAALTAWVGFIVFASDRSTVPPVEFWILGSLSTATWRVLWATLVLVGVGCVGLFLASRKLDLLTLGEREAGHLGVNVAATVSIVLIAVGTITGATVGAVGVIGFIGLVVPNALRPIVGPAHKRLLLVSALGGAGMLLGADLAARTMLSPTEVSVGLLTALVGGPFLLVLLSRARLA